jgi:hypothetical protein
MSTELLESTVVLRAPNTAFRELDGKMFIVGATSTKLVMLNETGTAVWSYLDQPRSVGQIADRLVVDFEVDRGSALADCRSFLEELASRELVLVEPGQELVDKREATHG